MRGDVFGWALTICMVPWAEHTPSIAVLLSSGALCDGPFLQRFPNGKVEPILEVVLETTLYPRCHSQRTEA